MEDERPRVGFGVYILNNKKELLLLRRKGPHAAGTWCPPGGHLEFKESFITGVKREAKEEAGIRVEDINFIGITNDIYRKERKHYITLAFSAKIKSGEPKIIETHAHDKIGWYPLNKLPKNLMLTNKNFFKSNPDCLCDSGKKFKVCCGKKSKTRN